MYVYQMFVSNYSVRAENLINENYFENGKSTAIIRPNAIKMNNNLVSEIFYKEDVLPGFEVPETFELVNGDFSDPLICNNSYQYVHQKDVRGWMTTDSQNAIEIVRGNGGGHAREILAPNDKQTFAEVNAYSVGELYQTVNTVPGDVLTWSFDHSARYKEEKGDTIGVNNGTLIREKVKAEGNYTNGMIAREKESNEVTSEDLEKNGP